MLKNVDAFLKGQLPTTKSIICSMLSKDKFLKREGAVKVATELKDLWI